MMMMWKIHNKAKKTLSIAILRSCNFLSFNTSHKKEDSQINVLIPLLLRTIYILMYYNFYVGHDVNYKNNPVMCVIKNGKS